MPLLGVGLLVHDGLQSRELDLLQFERGDITESVPLPSAAPSLSLCHSCFTLSSCPFIYIENTERTTRPP